MPPERRRPRDVDGARVRAGVAAVDVLRDGAAEVRDGERQEAPDEPDLGELVGVKLPPLPAAVADERVQVLQTREQLPPGREVVDDVPNDPPDDARSGALGELELAEG
eukprot:1366360-Pyramimonas_sp.AAC.1